MTPYLRMLLAMLVATAAMASVACASGDLHWGIAAYAPPALTVQLSLDSGFAVEVGVPNRGPAFCAAKLYPVTAHGAAVQVLPGFGLGGAIAFLPGDIVVAGLYAVVGLELPVPRSRLSLLADLAALLPLPIGAVTLDVSPRVGLRFGF